MDPRIAQSVLQLAATVGIHSLTKTAFVKYLYLLDVCVARHREGQKLTPWTWRFTHFGPYSRQAVKMMNSDGAIGQSEFKVDSRHRGTAYALRPATEYAPLPSDLGVPIGAQNELEQCMKKHKTNLSSLLDFVYYKTEPMENAEPDDILDFRQCRRVTAEQVEPISFPVPSKETGNRAKALIQQARESRLTSHRAVASGALDDVYYEGIALLEAEPLVPGVEGVATIDNDFGGDT